MSPGRQGDVSRASGRCLPGIRAMSPGASGRRLPGRQGDVSWGVRAMSPGRQGDVSQGVRAASLQGVRAAAPGRQGNVSPGRQGDVSRVSWRRHRGVRAASAGRALSAPLRPDILLGSAEPARLTGPPASPRSGPGPRQQLQAHSPVPVGPETRPFADSAMSFWTHFLAANSHGKVAHKFGCVNIQFWTDLFRGGRVRKHVKDESLLKTQLCQGIGVETVFTPGAVRLGESAELKWFSHW